jgi:hypothetical protein
MFQENRCTAHPLKWDPKENHNEIETAHGWRRHSYFWGRSIIPASDGPCLLGPLRGAQKKYWNLALMVRGTPGCTTKSGRGADSFCNRET